MKWMDSNFPPLWCGSATKSWKNLNLLSPAYLTSALADWAMETLLEIIRSFVLVFITAIKCLKNQILGKIKLPGFPMLVSLCALWTLGEGCSQNKQRCQIILNVNQSSVICFNWPTNSFSGISTSHYINQRICLSTCIKFQT